MICLRCGYCCHKYLVVIVKDPNKPLDETNLIVHHGDGNKPGEYSCSVHSKEWYKETPCYAFTQIESSPNEECRMGRYVLDNNITF